MGPFVSLLRPWRVAALFIGRAHHCLLFWWCVYSRERARSAAWLKRTGSKACHDHAERPRSMTGDPPCRVQQGHVNREPLVTARHAVVHRIRARTYTRAPCKPRPDVDADGGAVKRKIHSRRDRPTIAVTWVASADYETENGVSLSGAFPSSTLETLAPDQGVVVYEQVWRIEGPLLTCETGKVLRSLIHNPGAEIREG